MTMKAYMQQARVAALGSCVPAAPPVSLRKGRRQPAAARLTRRSPPCGATSVGLGQRAGDESRGEEEECGVEPFVLARWRDAAALCCRASLGAMVQQQLLERLVALDGEAARAQDALLATQAADVLADVAMEHWVGSAGGPAAFAFRAVEAAAELRDILSASSALRLLMQPAVAGALGCSQGNVARSAAAGLRFLAAEAGLSGVSLARMVWAQPGVLGRDAECALRPICDYLCSTYVDAAGGEVTLAGMLEEQPQVLMCSLDDSCVVDILGSPRDAPGLGLPAPRRPPRRPAATRTDFDALVKRMDPFGFAYGMDKSFMRDGVWYQMLPKHLHNAGLSEEDAAAVRDAVVRQVTCLNDDVGLTTVSLATGLLAHGVSPEEVTQLLVRCPRAVQCARPPPRGSRRVLAALVGLGGLDGAGLVAVLTAAPEVLGLEVEGQLAPLLRALRDSLRVNRPFEAAEVLVEQPQLLLLRSTSELRLRLLETGVQREIKLHSLKSLMDKSFGRQTRVYLSTAQQAAERLGELGFTHPEAAALSELMVKLQLEGQVFYTGRCPSLEDMVATCEAMLASGVRTDAVAGVFQAHPELLRVADKAGVQSVVQVLVERLGLVVRELETLLVAQPKVLGLRPSQELLPTLDALAAAGWAPQAVRTALGAHPEVLLLGAQKVVSALEYLTSDDQQEPPTTEP